MMHQFLSLHRRELEQRCKHKVAARLGRAANLDQLGHGIPIFLDQLIRALHAEEDGNQPLAVDISGPASGDSGQPSELGETAARHGADLLMLGFTIHEVVHAYGDLCQAISDLSIDLKQHFETDEFRTLNRCLDNGIADAVTEFSHQRDQVIAGDQAQASNEKIGHFAHELRNHLHTAKLAWVAIKSGDVGVAGATGAVLERSLSGLDGLIGRSLSEVRIGVGSGLRCSAFALNDIIDDVRQSAGLEARQFKCTFVLGEIPGRVILHADRDMLFSALTNLLQNAFKFSGADGMVTLAAAASPHRVRITVSDNGPGLAELDIEQMFLPFTQSGNNKTGLGLGLAIARRSIEANGGLLTAESRLGHGCIFAIDLPHADMRAAAGAV